MDRRFLIGWPLLFVFWMAGDMVVHGMLLGADYTALQGTLYRTPEQAGAYFPLMLLAHVMLAGAFVGIYARGVDAAKPWTGQGLRFGLATALLTALPTHLIYYVVQPTPLSLALRQMVYTTLLMLVLGLVVAWWYRPRTG